MRYFMNCVNYVLINSQVGF